MIPSSDIQGLARTRPFRPFRIVTSSGETYNVSHPELIMIGHREIYVGTPSKRNPTIYRKLHPIWLPHVTAVEVLPDTGDQDD